jgi:hypothetical protein
LHFFAAVAWEVKKCSIQTIYGILLFSFFYNYHGPRGGLNHPDQSITQTVSSFLGMAPDISRVMTETV